MQPLVMDPSSSFDQKLKTAYDYLDAFINAEEKDKSTKDLAAWASEVNKSVLEPVNNLFKEKFGSDSPVKLQMLDANPKVKKDDHLKRLKANRYNIFTYQRKVYLENAGDL